MANNIIRLGIRFEDGQRYLDITFDNGIEMAHPATRKAVDGMINTLDFYDEEIFLYEDANPEWEQDEKPRVVNATTEPIDVSDILKFPVQD